MEPLFKLALIRPAITQDPNAPSISLIQDTSFQRALAQPPTGELRNRDTLRRTAREYVNDATLFIGEPSVNPLASKLAALATKLDQLEAETSVSRAAAVAAITDAFGADPETLVNEGTLEGPKSRLRDSLLAIKHLREEHVRPIDALGNQLRDLELIDLVAADNAIPSEPAALRRYRRRSLEWTPAVELKSPVTSTSKGEEERHKQQAEQGAERRTRAETVFAAHQRLKRTVAELTSLGPENFQLTPQNANEGTTPGVQFTRTGMLDRRQSFLNKLADLNLNQLQHALDRGAQIDPLHVQDVAGASSAGLIANSVLDRNTVLSGSPPFRPLNPGDVAFKLHAGAANILSSETRAVLKERSLPPAERPLDKIVESLTREMESTAQELERLYDQPARRSFKKVGNTAVTVFSPVPSVWTSISVSGGYEPVPQLPPLPQSIPSTKGNVKPAGVADLLIVKQQLIGYEVADVAHIENVLRGERKLREHTRRQVTEEIIFTETETTKTDEHELESTDRFEMTREASATIREDAAMKAGLTVSGSYGPTVEFSASAEGSTSRSKEEATKSAVTFSQEVTEKSATKIAERVLKRASLRTTTEVTEKNDHELNNVAGEEHIRGVYQWVNKVYQAQMFNYGVRMMFDFMVPEPASFLLEVMKANHANAVELTKPIDFTLRPQDICEENVGFWIKTYHATDVAPLPELYKTKSADFKAGGGDEQTNYNHSGQITIDEGYVAIQGSVGKLINTWSDEHSVAVVLGRRVHSFKKGDPWVWITPLENEQDTIPFAIDTFDVSQVSVAIEVKCQRSARAEDKWRHETHAKLTTAYKARLSEYEDKLAALELQAGVAIGGKNPLDNLALMNDELKKNCISILTDQHYDLFEAIDIAWSNGLPQINVTEAEAEGAYVRFFEQAFEWEHMTWLTYPYFWGRKHQWDERLAFDDADPLLKQFVRAGYARVSVPARPGFEGAIDHFMHYGELWNGGPLPPISSPLYLLIADELAQRLDRPGDELPQGEPWLVRIPTTLVRLRDDDALPRWEQDEDGAWVPV